MRARIVKADEARTDAAHKARAAQVVAVATEAATANRTAAEAWDALATHAATQADQCRGVVRDGCVVVNQAAAEFQQRTGHPPFTSVHASIHNHFNHQRHLNRRDIFKQGRAAALAEWRQLAV